MQVFCDIQGSFKCRINNGPWRTYKNLVIKENVMHQLDTNNSVQLLIYLDAETTIAKELKAKFLDGSDVFVPNINIFDFVSPHHLQQSILHANPQLLLKLVNDILYSIAGRKDKPVKDERITLAEQLITNDPCEASIQHVASTVFLSESRLRSVFKKVTGVSLHKYIIWSKIRFAINRIMAGDAVTEAAIEAGFTDSSHFNKMLVKMFGIGATQFTKSNKKLSIVTCDQSPLSFETSFYNKQGEVEKIYK